MSKTTSTARSSIGLTIGRALGNTAAYTVHGAIRAGQMTGQFGKDVAAGAGAAYAEKAAQLAAEREELEALLTAEEAGTAPAKVKRQPAIKAPAAAVRKSRVAA